VPVKTSFARVGSCKRRRQPSQTVFCNPFPPEITLFLRGTFDDRPATCVSRTARCGYVFQNYTDHVRRAANVNHCARRETRSAENSRVPGGDPGDRDRWGRYVVVAPSERKREKRNGDPETSDPAARRYVLGRGVLTELISTGQVRRTCQTGSVGAVAAYGPVALK